MRTLAIPMLKTATMSGFSVDEVFRQAVSSFGGGIALDDRGGPRFVSGGLLPQGFRLRITDDSTSPDSGQEMLEQSVLLEITDPRDRLLYCKPTDIFNMVGLFIYLLRGSQSLSDIEFYNPIARKFTDEEVSNTTLRANWGERIFASGALARIITVLKNDYNSRRAYLSVFSQDDIGVPSRNLPCLAGIQFSRTVSDPSLDMFVTMRSQSAIGVLPYDLFLLTMLHEYVAMRVSADVGTYVHFAPIFGIRDREIKTYMELSGKEVVLSQPMRHMDPLTAGQKSLLLDCEKHIRGKNFKVADELYQKLPPYWQSILDIVWARRFVKDGNPDWEYRIDHGLMAFPWEFLEKAKISIQYSLDNPR